MSTLAEDIELYREKKSRLVGIVPNPPERNTDNGILYTATACVLGAITEEELNLIAGGCGGVSGCYSRYPTELNPSSWDDHLGLACASRYLAPMIYHYGCANSWMWGTDWLARIPIFYGTVRAAAGAELGWGSILYTALPFITDCFVKKDETNGRCTLYLAQKVLFGKSKLLDQIMDFWRWRMKGLYPGGMRDVYAIYFGPEHPFTKYGPGDFS